jgi:hypothetical protein
MRKDTISRKVAWSKAVSRQPHDEAVYRVGRLLFGETWIDELSSAEFDLGKKHSDREGSLQRIVRGEPFPNTMAKEAIAAARAATRFQIWSTQIVYVTRWLYAQKIDCHSQKAFDSDKFEKWFADAFGDYEKNATVRRRASVKKLYLIMKPGRGGVRWKEFCNAVCKDCGEYFDQKTIERDVQMLRRAG